jgi:hypothetical protein
VPTTIAANSGRPVQEAERPSAACRSPAQHRRAGEPELDGFCGFLVGVVEDRVTPGSTVHLRGQRRLLRLAEVATPGARALRRPAPGKQAVRRSAPAARSCESSGGAAVAKTPCTDSILLGGLLFIALNAFASGCYAMAGAAGPDQWLAGSPFTDYRVPGLILFVVVGGAFLIACVTVLGRDPRARPVAYAAAAVVLAWLAAQIAIIGYVSWMQPVTAAAALAVLALAQRLPATRCPLEDPVAVSTGALQCPEGLRFLMEHRARRGRAMSRLVLWSKRRRDPRHPLRCSRREDFPASRRATAATRSISSASAACGQR